MEAAELERVVVAGHETLWVRLVALGVRMGLPFQDAEDVAQESILTAMSAYDPARGDFGGLAYTACRNRAKSALARRRPTVSTDGIDTPDLGPDPLRDLLRHSHDEEVERAAAAVLALLDEDEARLFYELGRVLEERGSRAVSEAARSMGLTPQQGWDLLRKIQRKALAANLRMPEFEDVRVMRYVSRSAPRPAAAPPPLPPHEWALHDESRDRDDSVSAAMFTREPPEDDHEALAPASARRSWRAARRETAPVVAVTPDAIRRPWAGFLRFLEGLGADARRRLSEIPG